MKTLLAMIFFMLCSHIYAIEAFLWRQTPDAVPVIMPLKPGQTPTQAIDEYYSRFERSPHLVDIIENEEIKDLRSGQSLRYEYGEIKPFEFNQSHKPRFIVVTNELSEVYGAPYNFDAANVYKKLNDAGAEVIILPVVHDLNLNSVDSKLYREKIIGSFDAMLILGGTDIDPYLYGDQVTHALHVNRRRDISELKFTRQFIEAKKGMSFGICRGHQMCAVSHRNRLVQDIQIERDAPHLHRNGTHVIAIDRNSQIFSDFGHDHINVNSYHHQEVIVPDNDPNLRVVATSLDNTPIVEAMEFRNGLGASLQFHPELMDDEVGTTLMKRFVKLTTQNKFKNSNCNQIIKSMSLGSL